MGLNDKVNIHAEIPIRSFLVYCYVCKIEKGIGKYLLLKRANQYLRSTWQPTTGRIEPNETAWQTALREVKEETSLVPGRLFSANRVEQFYEPSHDCICVAPIFVAFIDTDQPVKLSTEHSDFQWVACAEACDLLTFPQQCDTLKYIETEFIQKDPVEFLKVNQ